MLLVGETINARDIYFGKKKINKDFFLCPNIALALDFLNNLKNP